MTDTDADQCQPSAVGTPRSVPPGYGRIWRFFCLLQMRRFCDRRTSQSREHYVSGQAVRHELRVPLAPTVLPTMQIAIEGTKVRRFGYSGMFNMTTSRQMVVRSLMTQHNLCAGGGQRAIGRRLAERPRRAPPATAPMAPEVRSAAEHKRPRVRRASAGDERPAARCSVAPRAPAAIPPRRRRRGARASAR
jgi:hypothetical protein